VTSSRSARRARRNARRRPEPVPQLRTAAWDATTITFEGASDAGLPDDAIYGPAPASPDDAVTVTPEWRRP